MVGGGPFRLKPGEWTDDTSMALCLGESLIQCKRFDPADQMKRYLKWYREGYLSSNGRCFDIGNTVRQALTRFERTGDPFSGPTDPQSAGNGSIMRLGPVPMFYASDPLQAIEKSAASSRTTHGAVAAVDACRHLGALVASALNGTPKKDLLADHYSPAPGCWAQKPLVKEIDEIVSGSFKRREPPEIQGTGYVVKSLEAALWAFHKSRSFEEGCLLAVNLGDDTDTTGGVYGQLAGAFYGAEAIPKSWRSRIALLQQIESFADQLFEISNRVSSK